MRLLDSYTFLFLSSLLIISIIILSYQLNDPKCYIFQKPEDSRSLNNATHGSLASVPSIHGKKNSRKIYRSIISSNLEVRCYWTAESESHDMMRKNL